MKRLAHASRAVAGARGRDGGSAFAQTNLRIGLAEDPDVLDPTLARTYVGRIVFASICDKLFDIDEKLNIVPQLALSHETSADGKEVTIKLRPGVKFHDGEPFDAEAAKYSLDRHLTMKGSFRKPELGSVDKVEVVDPLTIKLLLKAPFSPLLAQLTDRAGMMVSPKAAEAAGDKFGLQAGLRRSLQVRRARPAGPHRGREVRRLLEQGQCLHRQDHLPADRRRHGAAGQPPSGGLDLIERVLATDIKTVRDNPKLKLSKAVSLGYQRPHHQPRQRPQGRHAARQGCRACAGLRALDRPRRDQPGRVQRRVRAGQPVGQPDRIPTISRNSRSPSATSPRPRRC